MPSFLSTLQQLPTSLSLLSSPQLLQIIKDRLLFHSFFLSSRPQSSPHLFLRYSTDYLLIMLSLKSLVSAAVLLTLNILLHTNAAPTRNLEKRLMLPTAPVASAINGVSILLENDVDSSKVKYSFLLLSQPRGYYDGMDSCLSLGDGKYILPFTWNFVYSLASFIFHLSLTLFPQTLHMNDSNRGLHFHPRNSRCNQPGLLTQQQFCRSARSLWLLSVLGL